MITRKNLLLLLHPVDLLEENIHIYLLGDPNDYYEYMRGACPYFDRVCYSSTAKKHKEAILTNHAQYYYVLPLYHVKSSNKSNCIISFFLLDQESIFLLHSK